MVRYEDMRADPAAALARVLAFLGTPGSDEQIAGAVAYAAYDNMKQLEQKKVFWLSGTRLRAGRSRQPGLLQGPARQGRRLAGLFRRPRGRRPRRAGRGPPAPPFGYGAEPPARQRA